MSIKVASVRALTIPSGRERDSVSDHTIRGRSQRRSSLLGGFSARPGRQQHRSAQARYRSGLRWCLADCGLMAGAYEMLAADYDWMFDDDAVANGRAINLPATARLLQRISRTNRVLDAACGTGVDAAVLARRGFTVWAADGSEAMVGGAAARFRREGVGVPPFHRQWGGPPPAPWRAVCRGALCRESPGGGPRPGTPGV